ncbi:MULTISPECIES: hypothetical protein, partial [unclassified Actinomyces]|uniref:hypothetical protein n=1 Tax=unclassified Actinomyces TaxID=2609248 RepID=UPI002016C99B
MTRPRHGLVAIVATALLALTLTSVSPAAADGVASDASSQKQGTYATPSAAAGETDVRVRASSAVATMATRPWR